MDWCSIEQARWLEPYIALLVIVGNAVAAYAATHARQNARRLERLDALQRRLLDEFLARNAPPF